MTWAARRRSADRVSREAGPEMLMLATSAPEASCTGAATGVPLRHVEQGRNVPMYRTNREARPAGSVHGPLVVSMRPVPADQVATAVRVTSRYPSMHGAPVHVGDPGALGLADLDAPDFGDPVEVRDSELPVFWACGVTPQAAVMASRPSFAIGHAPGHMAVTDLEDADFLVP